MLARLTNAKLQKLKTACTVPCNFGVCTQASEHKQCIRDACQELTLGLPHYTCSVATDTVHNKMQLSYVIMSIVLRSY